jgi:hypothetical protein
VFVGVVGGGWGGPFPPPDAHPKGCGYKEAAVSPRLCEPSGPEVSAMPIPVTCPCGKTFQAPHGTAGKEVRCPDCRRAVLVPIPVARPIRPDEDDEPEADGAAGKSGRRRKKRPARSNQTTVLLLLGCLGLGLLGCLGVTGGLALYYFKFSGSAAERQLVGAWEMDPDSLRQRAGANPFGAQVFSECKLTFNADHTYKLSFFIEQEGKWRIVSGDDRTARVKLVAQMAGMDADPVTVTVTFVDKDHMDFDSDQKGLTLKGRFRRVGSGR